MDTEKYEELLRLLDPLMVAAEMAPGDRSLVFSLSTPMTTKKEKFLLKTPEKYDKLDMLSRHKERSYRETAGNQPKSLVLIMQIYP